MPMDMRHSVDDGDGLGRFVRRKCWSIGKEWACVFEMEVRLKGFCEDVTCVVPAFYSPNSHHILEVILPDRMDTQVNGSRMIRHCWLCGYMFGRLIVSIKVVVMLSVPKEL